MKVIYAGFSKTGTKTMCSALNILGYNTYDYAENVYYLYKTWNKIMTTGATSEEIRKKFEGVDAVTDAPCFEHWEELHHAFPEAKIILTIREEESWYKSLVKQLNELSGDWFFWLATLVAPTMWLRRNYRSKTFRLVAEARSWPSTRLEMYSETHLKRVYRMHNEYVLKHAPKDKLLVYKVTDGWEPLCSFLGEKVPDQVFPHKNKGAVLLEEMRKENKVMKRVVKETFVMLSLIVALGSFAAYKLYESWSTR